MISLNLIMLIAWILSIKPNCNIPAWLFPHRNINAARMNAINNEIILRSLSVPDHVTGYLIKGPCLLTSFTASSLRPTQWRMRSSFDLGAASLLPTVCLLNEILQLLIIRVIDGAAIEMLIVYARGVVQDHSAVLGVL